MLYLHPPFHRILGVSVFRDYADTLQYYYMPLAPKLTMAQNETSGEHLPQFQLIKFRNASGGGGLLNFDVNIGIDPDHLEQVRRQIQNLEGLREPPRMASLPLVDGSVKVMLLGQQSGETATNSEDERFAIKMVHHAKPALYGDNQASFSVLLDQDSVVMLEKAALEGDMLPIGVVYSLDYLALRPAYSVRVHADWERVQKHFEEHFGVDSIFLSASIDKAIDELIEDRAILIEVDTFVPEGEDSDGVIQRRDQAVNEVRDMVTETFFEPSLDPMTRVGQERDGWDKAMDILERGATLHARYIQTGGTAFLGSFTRRKVDLTRIDRKVLNVNMHERTTVKRSIYPQGHLRGMFHDLRESGMDLSRFVLPGVDLDHPWFSRRKVRVISRANVAEDAISSINVKLQYGDHPQNVILESGTDQKSVEWASLLNSSGFMQREVTASYTVTFNDIDGTERPVTLASPEEVIDVENLEITPRELYAIVHVPVQALNFPWDRYPQVEVYLRYTDEAHGIDMDDTVFLSEQAQEQMWKILVRDTTHTRFRYKLIYRAADHRDVEMPWVEADEEQVHIRDPFPQKRTLVLIPAPQWSEVSMIFADLAYKDAANGVSQTTFLQFDQNDASPKTFTVDLVNPDLRRVAYKVTYMLQDGHIVDLPWSTTLEPRVFLRRDMKGRRTVMLRPEEVDFATARLKEMQVEIQYEDADAGLSVADAFAFKAPGDRAHFEFDYVDAQKDRYAYRVMYQFTNGLVRTTDWGQSDVEELVVPVA